MAKTVNKNKKDTKAEAVQKTAPAFTLDQLLAAKSFASRKDALKAALSPDKRYTVAEAMQALNDYLGRKV